MLKLVSVSHIRFFLPLSIRIFARDYSKENADEVLFLLIALGLEGKKAVKKNEGDGFD